VSVDVLDAAERCLRIRSEVKKKRTADLEVEDLLSAAEVMARREYRKLLEVHVRREIELIAAHEKLESDIVELLKQGV
jgi:hypothetical protein